MTGQKAREARRKAVEKRANWLRKKHEKNMNTGDLAPIVVETSRLHSEQMEESTSSQEAIPVAQQGPSAKNNL